MLQTRDLETWYPLLEHVPVSVIVTDAEGTVTLWNRHAEELFGWTADEATGRSILDLTVPLDDRVAEAVMDAVAAGDTWEGRYRARRKDGQLVDIQIVEAPVYDENGVLSGVIGVSVDVSAAARNERWLRALVEEAAEEIVVVGRDGTVTYVTPSMEGLTDRPMEQSLLTDPLDLFHPDSREAVAAALEAVRSGPDERHVLRSNVLRADGSAVPVVVTVRNLLKHPDVHGIVLNVRDISVTVEAERTLQAAVEREEAASAEFREVETLHRSFIESTTHELRTPLSVLQAAMGLLTDEDRQLESDQRRAVLDRMQRQLERLRLLVDSLLQLQRIDQQPRRTVVDVARLVEGVVGRLEAEDHPLTVEVEARSAFVDPDMLSRALGHLIDNVNEHTPPGVSAHLRVPSDDGLRIVVEDDGPGLPGSLADELTQPFVRGPDPASGHLGIGLAIVKRVAQAHGGRIEVGPSDRGGTKIELHIPDGTTAD